jgi:hypothetical protein
MAVSVRPRWWKSRRRLSLLAVGAFVAAPTSFGVYAALVGGPGAGTAVADAEESPARVEPIGKTGLNRVVLNSSAAKRLDIKTAPVSNVLVNGKRRSVVPYAAVLYDSNGDTWTYTSPKPLVYVRHDIRVDYVKADLAVLSFGPHLGTAVVTAGAAELWGIEYGGIEED